MSLSLREFVGASRVVAGLGAAVVLIAAAIGLRLTGQPSSVPAQSEAIISAPAEGPPGWEQQLSQIERQDARLADWIDDNSAGVAPSDETVREWEHQLAEIDLQDARLEDWIEGKMNEGSADVRSAASDE